MKLTITLSLLITLFSIFSCKEVKSQNSDRQFWIETMLQVADPVLKNLSEGTLKQNMPFESLSIDSNRRKVSYLEATGRLICGMAPWLELGADETEEGALRAKYIDLTVRSITHAVDPDSPDYLTFGLLAIHQPLVDAAFLAQGLLRAPTQLWGNLSPQTQEQVITELRRSREIKAWNNNWLLFASMVEVALLEFSGEYDSARLYYGVDKFKNEWYKGDGWYGDGPNLKIDYYNSFVIHPMLTDILKVMRKHQLPGYDFLETQIERHARYAAQLERFISPEGTYPVVGRSIVYRFGAFHALSQAALLEILPPALAPEQVRCGLTSVIRRQMESPRNFDPDGWLRVGFTGEQINMSESYINTGSLYLCATVFLPLGLPPTHPFWVNPGKDWSSKKAWNGEDIGRN